MPETTTKPRKKATKAVKPTETGGSTVAPKKPAEPRKKTPIGRPTKYDTNIASEICVRISNGESLRQICMADDMPAQSTVYLWLTLHPAFSEMYARAREEQADTLADEIIAIADEQPEIIAVVDKKTGALIEHKLDGAFLQWQKNRIDARKWTAMKLKPKKYGDKIALGGDGDAPPIKTEDMGSTRLFEVIRAMEMSKRAG
jgi:hypothetical protein